MSLNDARLRFDAASQAITVTRDSTDTIDLGAGSDLGDTDDLWVNVAFQTTFTAAGAATLTIALQGAPNNAGVPGTWTTYIITPALAVADLVAGTAVSFRLPKKILGVANNVFPRFLKLVYTVATGPMTAGAVQAWLGANPVGMEITHQYPSGFTVTN